MASSSIKGITIKLDGDTSGLVKSLDTVEKQIKEDDKALKNLEQALKLDPGNIDLLAAKQALLAEKTEAVTEKMNILEDIKGQALEAIGDGADIANSSMADLEAQIALTNNSLNSLETESAATDAALNGFGDSTEGAGDNLDALGDAAEGAGDDLDEAGNEAENAGNQIADSGSLMESFGDAAETAGEVAVAAFTAVAAAATAIGGAIAAGTTALVDMAVSCSATGDEIDKMSQKVGLSSESYQKWDYVLQLAGTDMASMKTGLKTLTNKMDDAVNGNEKAIASFEAIGISLEDLAGMSREDLFAATVTAFQGMEDTAERAALANDLLGKSGIELIPIFNQSAEATKQLMDQAEQYGIIMSDELVEDSAAFNDSLTTLEKTTEGFKNNLVGQFLPGLTLVTDGLAGVIAGVDGSEDSISQGIDNITVTFEKIIPQLEGIINKIVPVILPLGEKLISTLGTSIINNLPAIITFATTIVTNLVNALLKPSTLSALLNAGVSVILTLVSGIAKALPQLVPAALSAIDTLAKALLAPEMITTIITAAAEVALSIVQGLAGSMDDLIPQVAEAFLIIVETLTAPEVLGPLLSATLDLILAICEGLMNSADELGQAVITIIGNVIIVLAEHLPEIIEFIIESTAAGLGTLFNLILGLLGSSIEDVFGDLSTVDSDIDEWFVNLVSSVGEFLGNLFGNIGEFFSNIISDAATFFSDIWSDISSAWDNITGGFSQFCTDLWNGLVSLATDVINKVIEIKDGIAEKLSNLASDALSWGKDMVQSFIDGIMQKWENLKSTLNSVAELVKNILGFSVPEAGPLHEWAYNNPGADMMKFYAGGIYSGEDTLKDALDTTANNIVNALEPRNYEDVIDSPAKPGVINYSKNFDRIADLLSGSGSEGADGKQIIIPIYLGNSLLDTIVVDALDRYNYATGGH